MIRLVTLIVGLQDLPGLTIRDISSIKQNDIPKLSHTNAQVLAYLLEPRNRQYVCAVDTSGKRLGEKGLLEKLKNSRIRVLVDAGAQIIEHDNKSFARLWLNTDEEAKAAVFFEADHRPWILHKKGKLILLVASVFADNLEKCLVYLDESHCRGTDLKLPATTRAALTLGPHLTKDSLVQAAMRLRLLGQTQSVTFFSPPEVHQSILDQRQASKYYQPDSSDVISWLLEQTCNGIEQCEPLYFTQGTSYLQRVQSRIDNPEFLQQQTQLEQFLLAMRSKEMTMLIFHVVHDWLAIRRKSQDFEYTPMGHLTTGKSLFADHPFFVSDTETGKVKEPKLAIASFAARRQEHSESEDDDDDSVDEHDEDDGDVGCIADYVNGNDEGSDEDGNAFFDTEEYYDNEKK